jgi:acetoin utilization protein AcuB
MYVGWNMKTYLITASPDTSVLKAREMMDTHKISHLPVTDGKAHLLGIVTDRDLKQAWASPASTLSIYELTYILQKLTVEAIMTTDVITATPDLTIERAALIIHDHKIGALPVVEGKRLVGIITCTDLMEVLLMALGMGEESGRLSVLARNRIGVLAEIGRIMQQAAINILSIVTTPLRGYEDVWQLIMRVNLAVQPEAVRVLEQAGFKVITHYVENVTPYLPN